MDRAHVLHVVGARPNFIKAAPVIAALDRVPGISQALVHTGQHYDANMSEVFFRQLGLPEPDVNLEVGSASHSVQTAQIMVRFEELVQSARPDLVLVYGDVNSTVAAALVCAKLLIPVGHVEAGLRSFDRTMPEEINRLLTDQIADLLFTPSADGDENLLREGIAPAKIYRVGNVMIDTLVRLLPLAEGAWQSGRVAGSALFRDGGQRYVLVTLHRPSNVDAPDTLLGILSTLADISRDIPVIFPVHPRTRQRLETLGRPDASRFLDGTLDKGRLHVTEPLGYLEFLALQAHAALVITDSGGIQEETTFLGVPCLTVRANTERPITTTCGTNILVGQDMERLRQQAGHILEGRVPRKQGRVPPLWDGHAAQRLADVIQTWRRGN